MRSSSSRGGREVGVPCESERTDDEGEVRLGNETASWIWRVSILRHDDDKAFDRRVKHPHDDCSNVNDLSGMHGVTKRERIDLRAN